MGAVGLNAAAKQAAEPTDRIRVANAGWARWTPVNTIGIAAYAAGGTTGPTPAPETPSEVRKIQRQLKLLQYAIPGHVGGLIAITALMSEQQRTSQVVQGVTRRFLPAA
jgi:hypothetical protein